jgi:hypothetical protein
LTNGKLDFDTTTWTDGIFKYQVTVTDSSGRTASSAELTINTFNPRPVVTVGGVTSGGIVAGKIDFSVEAQIPKVARGLTIKSYCYFFNGKAECSEFRNFNIDTTRLKNGNYLLTVAVIDSADRTTSLSNIPITSKNPKASIKSVKPVIFRNWTVRDKKTKIYLNTSVNGAEKLKIKYGTSARSLNRTKWIDTKGGIISGLRSRTKYYFSAQAFGLNGNSKTVRFSASTR